jgi:hypothetical protein
MYPLARARTGASVTASMLPGRTRLLLASERFTFCTFTTGRLSIRLRFRRQHRFAAAPRQVTREEPDHHQRHQHQGDRQQSEARRPRRLLRAGRRQLLMFFQLALQVLDFRAQLVIGGMDLVHGMSSRSISSRRYSCSSSTILRA